MQITTSSIVSVLAKSGRVSEVRTRRVQRDGYKVRQVNRRAICVFFDSYPDPAAESEAVEALLLSAGFKVQRPFDDKNLLGVTCA